MELFTAKGVTLDLSQPAFTPPIRAAVIGGYFETQELTAASALLESGQTVVEIASTPYR